jgi:hypothetical protein
VEPGYFRNIGKFSLRIWHIYVYTHIYMCVCIHMKGIRRVQNLKLAWATWWDPAPPNLPKFWKIVLHQNWTCGGLFFLSLLSKQCNNLLSIYIVLGIKVRKWHKCTGRCMQIIHKYYAILHKGFCNCIGCGSWNQSCVDRMTVYLCTFFGNQLVLLS